MGWFTSDFKKDARRYKSEELQAIFAPLQSDSVILRDGEYDAPTIGRFRDLVWKHHDRGIFAGDKTLYKKDFADCDDFSLWAMADVTKGAYKQEGFEKAPAFGRITFLPKGKDVVHMTNIAVDASGKVWLYEPQSGKWKDVPTDARIYSIEL